MKPFSNLNVGKSTLSFLLTSRTKLISFLGGIKLFTTASKKLKILLEGKGKH